MATASNSDFKNGYQKTPQDTDEGDVKILVVGERGCGKTTFIKSFWKNQAKTTYDEQLGAIVYKCEYDAARRTYNVFIYEIVCGTDEETKAYIRLQMDTNAFVLMYAVDDPNSFEQIKSKWFHFLSQEGLWERKESAILVGNKIDLRENPQVIQRLARNNQTPVTEEDGENLVKDPYYRLRKYFGCKSVEPYHNIDVAFNHIISWGITDEIGEIHGYHMLDTNPSDVEDPEEDGVVDVDDSDDDDEEDDD